MSVPIVRKWSEIHERASFVVCCRWLRILHYLLE
jgi:hypothetical protein